MFTSRFFRAYASISPPCKRSISSITRIGTDDPRMSRIVVHNDVVYISGLTDATAQDIEGQTRPAVSNYGADHFSSDATLYKPLTANDVGPFSNATTSIQYQPLDDLNVLVYPIPAKDFLIIDDIPTGFDQLYLYNIKGEQIIGKELQSTDAKIQLDLSAVSNGIYTISLLGEKGFFAKKIMILK